MMTVMYAGLIAAICLLSACTTTQSGKPEKRTLSSFDPAKGAGARIIPAGGIRFVEADLAQVLKFYEDLSGRTVVLSPQTPRNIKITLENKGPINAVQTLQLLDTTLALQGVTTVLSGDDTVKVVPTAIATTETPPEINIPEDQLPDSSSYMTRRVTLKHLKPEVVTGMIQPFAKLPNSIIAVKDSNLIILRDYSSNIRQMLRIINEAETNKLGGAPRKRSPLKPK